MKQTIKARQKMIRVKKTKFSLLAVLGGFAFVALAGHSAQAQQREFLGNRISCSSSWGSGIHEVDFGTISDPSAIGGTLKDVPVDAGCESWQFLKTPGKNEWKAHGAYCLTVVTNSGSAAQRELTLVGDPTAPTLKFNFAHAGGTSPADAIGDAVAAGVGVPYYGVSTGANIVANGPNLPIGDTNNDFGVYIHPASQQPTALQAGEYEGTFTWRLYAGTTAFQGPYAPPFPATCGTKTGNLQQTGQIKIKVKVAKSCTLKVQDINFGKVTLAEIAGGLGPEVGNLEIKCNNKNDMFITLGAGENSGGNVNNRHMKLDGGSDLIKYSLIKPGGGEWGDAANSASGYLVPQTGSVGSIQIVPVEAHIPPQSDPFPSGVYKDNVQVQLWN